MSFLSINGPFNSFFYESTMKIFAEPSNYKQINVGNQEVHQGVNGNKIKTMRLEFHLFNNIASYFDKKKLFG